MRILSPSLALGSFLIVGLSGSALLAQDQSQAPADSQPQSSNAQPHHAANPNRQAKRMAKKLGLTPDQQAKIEPILADRQQQAQGVRSDATLAPDDRRAKMHGINQDSDAKIESILSDSQKQQYEQMKQSRKANKQQGAAPPTN